MPPTSEATLQVLKSYVGSWTTEASHPAFAGVVVRGSVVMEWLEGERFLIHRARTDHPDFPDSISIIGFTERARADKHAPAPAGEPELRMHYYDSRGVFRVYEMSVDAATWRLWRDVPGFSQRYVGVVADGGNTIVGRWQLREDAVTWNDDLQITYRRS
jgi:hypothetical protein